MAFSKENLQILLKEKKSPASIKEQIKFAGFNDDVASKFERFSEKKIFNQQNLFYWIENYLKENMSDVSSDPTNVSPRSNKWQDINTESFGTIKTVDIILPTPAQDDESKLNEKQAKHITDKLNELKASGHLTDGKQLWIHGTSKPSMENILENGIYLMEGSKKQDFSNGKGFYLSDQIDRIAYWALTKSKVLNNLNGEFKASLLVFEFEVNEEDNTEGLFLNEKKELWRKITKYHKAASTLPGEVNDVEDALKDKQFIHGLVCDGQVQDDTPPIPLENFDQLCIIKKGSFLKEVEQNLKAVINIGYSE